MIIIQGEKYSFTLNITVYTPCPSISTFDYNVYYDKAEAKKAFYDWYKKLKGLCCNFDLVLVDSRELIYLRGNREDLEVLWE